MSLFGPEKITLALEKYNFKPGDVIKGTVTLQLKKPTHARKLEVGLIGKQIQRQGGGIQIGSGAKHSSSSQHTTIYNFRIPLDGEKEYQQGTYPFELKIDPTLLQSQPQLEGHAATAVNVLKALGGVSSRVDWYVLAELDVPMKLDVNKTQQITISP